MAVPPGYGDLGKAARDLFSKGYNYGTHKLEVKTKAQNDVEFKVNASQNHDSAKFTGSLETKYSKKDIGLELTEKWNTDNTLTAEASISPELIKGSKFVFEGQFAPQTGKKSGKVKTTYKREHFNGSSDVNFDVAGPTVNASAVVGYNQWLLGYQMAFDTAKSKLSKNNVTLAYKNKDTELTTSVNDATDFNGTVYHKVCGKTEMGVDLSWSAGSNATKFGIAAKYTPDRFCSYRARLNNASQLGLCYQHQLKDGLTVTTSALIEGKNINAGGHKVGLGLEFSA